MPNLNTVAIFSCLVKFFSQTALFKKTDVLKNAFICLNSNYEKSKPTTEENGFHIQIQHFQISLNEFSEKESILNLVSNISLNVTTFYIYPCLT